MRSLGLKSARLDLLPPISRKPWMRGAVQTGAVHTGAVHTACAGMTVWAGMGDSL